MISKNVETEKDQIKRNNYTRDMEVVVAGVCLEDCVSVKVKKDRNGAGGGRGRGSR